MAYRWTAPAVILLCGAAVHARPVSYPGGTTIIQELDPMMASVHLHYSPDRHWSLGPRLIRMRDEATTLAGVQATWLTRRWNMPGAQANLYVAGMAGAAVGPARQPDRTGAAAFVEAQGDWENRRLMLMAMARVSHAPAMGTTSMQMARVGWAPYAGNYGDVHLWLFGQVMHDATNRDPVQPALVARLFYRTALLEAGLTDRGGLVVNSTLRF